MPQKNAYCVTVLVQNGPHRLCSSNSIRRMWHRRHLEPKFNWFQVQHPHVLHFVVDVLVIPSIKRLSILLKITQHSVGSRKNFQLKINIYIITPTESTNAISTHIPIDFSHKIVDPSATCCSFSQSLRLH